MNRYFIGFLVSIGLIVLILVLIFSGGKSGPKAAVAPSLPSYANTNTVVKMTTAGPITAAQNYNEVDITVGQNSTVFTHIQGFDNNVVSSQTFHNSQNSYNTFLYALDYAGYTKGNSDPAISNPTGRCSTGQRYTFQIVQNGKAIQNFWDTNCASGGRTYGGSLSLTLTLFQAQVPGYGVLTQSIQL
jgi:hypothetical protein